MLIQYLSEEQRKQFLRDKSQHDGGGAVWPIYDDRPQLESAEQQRLKQQYEADTYFEYDSYDGTRHNGKHESLCYEWDGCSIPWRNGIVLTTCRQCKRMYYRHASANSRIPDYCSYRCKNDAYLVQRKARQTEQRRKTCIVCGIIFDAKRKDARFCSNACRQANYRTVTNTRCGNISAADNCNT